MENAGTAVSINAFVGKGSTVSYPPLNLKNKSTVTSAASNVVATSINDTGIVYRLPNPCSSSITLSQAITIANGTTTTILSNTAISNVFEIISGGYVWRAINYIAVWLII